MFGATTSLESIVLPNATTWTAMVLVLVVMLFVRFNRPLQWRHWDLLLLFILAIPMLFLRYSQEERDTAVKVYRHQEYMVAQLVYSGLGLTSAPLQTITPAQLPILEVQQGLHTKDYWLNMQTFDHPGIWRGYFWLLVVTALLLFRTIFDLGLEQRPELRSNVTLGGMFWLMGVMLTVMILRGFLPEWQGIPTPKNNSRVVEFLTSVITFDTFKHLLAILCHGVIVTHLVLIGWLRFRNIIIGAAAALLYLLMPYTAILLLNPSHVLASMFIVMAVFWYRRPLVTGLLLGLGTSAGIFPVVLVPLWFGFYYRRGHWRFLTSYLMVIGVLFVVLAMVIGLGEIWTQVWSLAEWQAWKFASRTTADGLWNSVSLHGAYRIPLFIAFVALVVTSAFWPHPKHLGQLISWSAVLILGIQFWYADAGGSYILWYLPLLVLQTVRPTLTDVRPARINTETDGLMRLWRRFSRKAA
jgi:hypothetical protein